ncbi:MAG TPA: Rieske 2Fe-2S domain-containing protein [Acidimicrobiales bacterium]|nr:Rieske 2Fe-2S domain-containing protein [Acidimicrobiales bacterium]
MPPVKLCALSDLEPGRGHLVRQRGHDLAVFLVGGEVRVVDNTCLHTGGALADGPVVDGCVICPLHGWVYDLTTGQTVVGHRTAGNLRTYEAWVDNGTILASLDE